MRRDEPGCMGLILAWALFCLFVLTIGGTAALPVLNKAGLSWDTSAAQQWQTERTERERIQAEVDKVRAVEATKQAAETAEMLSVWAIVGGVATVLVVGAVQAGRTVRHRDEQITERVRLCRDYVAQHYLPGDDVEVRQVRGPWWPITPKRVEVVDHGAQEIVPVAVIEQTFMPPAVRR